MLRQLILRYLICLWVLLKLHYYDYLPLKPCSMSRIALAMMMLSATLPWCSDRGRRTIKVHWENAEAGSVVTRVVTEFSGWERGRGGKNEKKFVCACVCERDSYGYNCSILRAFRSTECSVPEDMIIGVAGVRSQQILFSGAKPKWWNEYIITFLPSCGHIVIY